MSAKKPEVVVMTHPNSKQTIRPTREQASLYAAQGWREKASRQDNEKS